MKIRTNELTDAALDWAVWAASGGAAAYPKTASGPAFLKLWRSNTAKYVYPSTDWAQGGPIIERERLEFDFREDEQDYACFDGYRTATGPTHLIAAMRCYCCAKLGDEIDIPEELCQQQSS